MLMAQIAEHSPSFVVYAIFKDSGGAEVTAGRDSLRSDEANVHMILIIVEQLNSEILLLLICDRSQAYKKLLTMIFNAGPHPNVMRKMSSILA